MKTLSYIIKDKEGIHARPAGVVVAMAKQYSSIITIENKGKVADLKRIFAVMSLGVKYGETIIVRAEGEDEDKAIDMIERALIENL